MFGLTSGQNINLVDRVLYPAPAPTYSETSFPDELIFVPREDGEQVPCLMLRFRHARFLLIYFHANAEDLGLCYTFCDVMRDLFQIHVMAVEYPGYGICAGQCDEAGILANARAAAAFATKELKWPCDGIKIFGRSLGTGPAMVLATEYPAAGLVLVSPFTSICDLIRMQVGAVADLLTERFRNIDLAAKVLCPTIVIHGQKDTLIPLAHAQEIFDALLVRKMMVTPPAMSHNSSLLKNINTMVLPMTQFFSLPDYTFEDLEVPAWVFPATSGLSQASCLDKRSAADSGSPVPLAKLGPPHEPTGLAPRTQDSQPEGSDAEIEVVGQEFGGPAATLAPLRGPLELDVDLEATRRYSFAPKAHEVWANCSACSRSL